MEGVKMDVIKAGAYKGAGIPGTSLDDSQREMLQKEVEEIHADFKEAVKSVRSFVEDSSMEGQTFSGKKGAEAGLVTALINGFDELVQSIDASVHAVIEADEEKEEQEEDGALAGSEGIKAKSFSEIMSEADSAISSFKARSSEEGEDEEDEDEDEEKKSEDEDEEKKSEDEDEEKKSEGDEDDEKKSEGDEDDDKDPKSEEKEDEDEDKPKGEGDEDGVEPQPDDEEEPEEGKSKEDAEDEDDSGDKAVDTDSKHNSSGVKKNRSKGVA
jgi:hypothetical protein